MWLETERLILRDWQEADIEPFHAMGQDAEVMRYLRPLPTRADVEESIARLRANQAEHGHCFWAIERRDDGALVGMCGLNPPRPHIATEIEIGWRLAREAWGHGFALEAARASVDWGWAHLDTPDIIAITVRANVRSWQLMERLGMVYQPDRDFDHPEVPEGDPLRPHILYRIERPG